MPSVQAFKEYKDQRNRKDRAELCMRLPMWAGLNGGDSLITRGRASHEGCFIGGDPTNL